MFKELKDKNKRRSYYHNALPARGQSEGLRRFHSNPRRDGTPSIAPIKYNEGDRLVRCRTCGFPCDKERDSQAKTGSWVGLGVELGQQKTAGHAISDGRSLVVTTIITEEGFDLITEDEVVIATENLIAPHPDLYYDRTVVAGCPCCGTLDYD